MKVKLKEIKRQWTKNGMRQIIDSPHKTFNNKTNLIDNRGNLITNTQTAYYIRAYNETECNGFTYKQGELQEFDMKYLDGIAINYIRQQDKNHKFWASQFRLNNLICIMLLNLNTMELKVFDFSKNNKQNLLINWLVDYLFEKE